MSRSDAAPDRSRPGSPSRWADALLWDRILEPVEPSGGVAATRGWWLPLVMAPVAGAVIVLSCRLAVDYVRGAYFFPPDHPGHADYQALLVATRRIAWAAAAGAIWAYPLVVTLSECRRHDAHSRWRVLAEMVAFWLGVRLAGGAPLQLTSWEWWEHVALVGGGMGLCAATLLAVFASFRRRRHPVYDLLAPLESIGDTLCPVTWLRGLLDKVRKGAR